MDTLREAKTASQRVIADDPLLQKEQNRDLKDAVVRLFRQTGASSLN